MNGNINISVDVVDHKHLSEIMDKIIQVLEGEKLTNINSGLTPSLPGLEIRTINKE